MNPWKDKRVIGNATLYLGDALDVIPALDQVDAIITDPPYGVALGNTKSGQERERGQIGYESFDDTPEYIAAVIVPAFCAGLEKAKRAALTPGNRSAFLYPKPADVGVWYNQAGTGRGKWGFLLAHLILYYGTDPNAGKRSTASSTWGLTKHDDMSGDRNNTHPCPKPLQFMEWMVGKASLVNESVLDPFMGSGTTGYACMKTNRRFIGIEIEPKYYEIACERIENAQRQTRMFA